MSMMREATEPCAGETLTADDDGRAAFVTLAEDLEEQLRAGLCPSTKRRGTAHVR
jgi:hypothetical protein